jgi:transketolase
LKISSALIQDLEERARIIRRHIVKIISDAGVGHPGGSLSAVDILTVLYFHVLRIDPDNPNWEDRDRFILSKGHASSALYSTLAEKGFFSIDLLSTFGRINSRLQVHPDMQKIPGIEASTGALGQGLSIGLGMALGARLDNKNLHVYVLLGDGEIQEGQVWEAAMSAAHYKVYNLTAILDYNRVQLMGPVSAIMEVAPVKEKWLAFGWNVIEIDGHDIKEIINSLHQARAFKGKPTIVIANTIKGRGCSFMEGKCEWHGKTPSKEELCRALSELE